jgi:hypothetical protein
VTPAVVAVAYNRPEALSRLLASIARARYPEAPVPLVISIDRGPGGVSAEVAGIARGFEWPRGPKLVIEREERLGVVGHFRACGDLTSEYGAIVLLEDDLVAGGAFYDFAAAALQAYGGDDRIGGLSLYSLSFNGFTHDPFLPVDDGGDVFFMKLPYTQGLAFTAEQWRRFSEFAREPLTLPVPGMHPAFSRFGADEWFPLLAAYLAATGRYFCFPRGSHTTGWGDAGAHFEAASSWFQAPLQVAAESFRLPAFDDALAVYDGFYEILPDRLARLAPGLPESFGVDLYATKAAADAGLVLTTRPARRAVARYGLRMYPPELNVACDVPGDEIALAAAEDVDWGKWAALEARRRLDAYFWQRRRPSRRRSLAFAAARLLERIRRGVGPIQSGHRGRNTKRPSI